MKKNKKIKIKQTKKNMFFVIVGRITTYIVIEMIIYKILNWVLCNCITTL